jgi:hypothetical protein
VNLSFRFPGEKPDGCRAGAILLARMKFVNPKVRGKRIWDLDAVASRSIRACCLVNAGRL